MFAPGPPDVLSVALLPIAGPDKVKNLAQRNNELPPDELVTVVLPIPSNVFTEPEAEAETKVVIAIPVSVLLQAAKAEKAVIVDLAFPSGVLLNSQLDTKFVAPVPIDDLTNDLEAIVVVPQNLAPLGKQAMISSTQSQAISPLLSLAAQQQQFSKDSAASASLDGEDQLDKSAGTPLINGSDDPTALPVELLQLIESVVAAPSPSAKDSTFRSDADSVLRYYNREGGSRNAYPYGPEWGIVDSEPVVALIDAHVLFAQEYLSRILAQSQISIVRLPRTTSSSPLPSRRHNLPSSEASMIVPSLPVASAGLPKSASILIRPVRSMLKKTKKILLTTIQGRKAWNPSGERDSKTCQLLIDLSLVKPLVVQKKILASDWGVKPNFLKSDSSAAGKEKEDFEDWNFEQEDDFGGDDDEDMAF